MVVDHPGTTSPSFSWTKPAVVAYRLGHDDLVLIPSSQEKQNAIADQLALDAPGSSSGGAKTNRCLSQTTMACPSSVTAST